MSGLDGLDSGLDPDQGGLDVGWTWAGRFDLDGLDGLEEAHPFRGALRTAPGPDPARPAQPGCVVWEEMTSCHLDWYPLDSQVDRYLRSKQ